MSDLELHPLGQTALPVFIAPLEPFGGPPGSGVITLPASLPFWLFIK